MLAVTKQKQNSKSKAGKFFLLLLLTVAVAAVYIGLVRPQLVKYSYVATAELIASGIVLAAAVITLLILAITIVITLIIMIFTNASMRPWLSRIGKQSVACLLLTVILGISIVISQFLAYTPPILNENGTPVTDSIAYLEKIELNGSKQWISIRGKSKSKPVLLFLAGGPGGSQLAAVRTQLKGLEEHFVVVGWDQPGSAKSFDSVPSKDLTPERYIADGCQLATYLCKRFNQEKIYLVGESWGSALGIWMVQKQPELFHSFVGTGQMVSFRDTEKYCYDLALKTAREKGDLGTVRKLEKQGLPPYYGKGVAMKMANYLLYLFKVMNLNPAITDSNHNTLQDMAGAEYGIYDKVNYIRGLTSTLNTVYQQLYELDLRKQAAELEVPIYFFEGRHDVNAPTALAEEYYNLLKAPAKKLIWFEKSGHTPWVNENELFVEMLVNEVLNK